MTHSYNSEFEIKETHLNTWLNGNSLSVRAHTHIEIQNIESLPAALKRLDEMGYDLSEARKVLQESTKDQPKKMSAEELAKFYHETTARLYPDFIYEVPRKNSNPPWDQALPSNRLLMIAVAAEVLKHLGLD